MKEEEIGGDFRENSIEYFYSSTLSQSPYFSQHYFGNHMDLKTTCRPILSSLHLTTEIHSIHLGSALLRAIGDN